MRLGVGARIGMMLGMRVCECFHANLMWAFLGALKGVFPCECVCVRLHICVCVEGGELESMYVFLE